MASAKNKHLMMLKLTDVNGFYHYYGFTSVFMIFSIALETSLTFFISIVYTYGSPINCSAYGFCDVTSLRVGFDAKKPELYLLSGSGNCGEVEHSINLSKC